MKTTPPKLEARTAENLACEGTTLLGGLQRGGGFVSEGGKSQESGVAPANQTKERAKIKVHEFRPFW